MNITGIICEYNPLHSGHKKQLDHIRQQLGADSGIVCLMSGSFVQRGAPAIFNKTVRAKAAVQAGADLVLEMPTTVSLSSAEGFAAGGVNILSGFCDRLCFGAEATDLNAITALAHALLSDSFSPAVRQHLDAGLSFPAARQAALADLGLDSSLLSRPNNILAVEYCKAILTQNSTLDPMIIHRDGDYHSETIDANNPSATALRKQILTGKPWLNYVPEAARDSFLTATPHAISHGERAILAVLRTMKDEDFEALPHGSEGLWRKLMHAARSQPTLEAIAQAVKSKRYTRSRIDRMLLCAFLGLTAQQLHAAAPYVRVLAFNDRGRMILKTARQHGTFLNIGERSDDPYQLLENKWGTLYGLFAADSPEPANREQTFRIYHQTD